MPIRLISDAEDDHCTFALYDPEALGDVHGKDIDRDLTTELVSEGRACVHIGRGGNQSPDNPGTERRVAWICVDEPLPEEVAVRVTRVVESSRLQVPSGKLYFASVYALNGSEPPEREGLLHGEAEIPPGDYHLEIHLADWGEDERERFVEERVEPSDLVAEHRLGCLAWIALALSLIVPVVLLLLYVGMPLFKVGYEPVPWLWAYLIVPWGAVWAAVFAWGKAPSQRRIIAAREARRAMNLPAPVYVLERREPGEAAAFHREATARARPVLS